MPEDPAPDLSAERARLPHAHAADYSRLAMDNIAREFPSDFHHTMTAPGDFAAYAVLLLS